MVCHGSRVFAECIATSGIDLMWRYLLLTRKISCTHGVFTQILGIKGRIVVDALQFGAPQPLHSKWHDRFSFLLA